MITKTDLNEVSSEGLNLSMYLLWTHILSSSSKGLKPLDLIGRQIGPIYFALLQIVEQGFELRLVLFNSEFLLSCHVAINDGELFPFLLGRVSEFKNKFVAFYPFIFLDEFVHLGSDTDYSDPSLTAGDCGEKAISDPRKTA